MGNKGLGVSALTGSSRKDDQELAGHRAEGPAGALGSIKKTERLAESRKRVGKVRKSGVQPQVGTPGMRSSMSVWE